MVIEAPLPLSVANSVVIENGTPGFWAVIIKPPAPSFVTVTNALIAASAVMSASRLSPASPSS